MNYGNYGKELLLELKRSSKEDDPSLLPAYNDSTVSACLQDLTLHVQELQNLAVSQQQGGSLPQEVRPSLLLQEAAIQRNKRCLLTYHWVRMQRLLQQPPPLQTKNLAPAEVEMYEKYQKLQAKYMQGLPVDDLHAHAGYPPVNSDGVLVRVVKAPTEGGAIVLTSGRSVQWITGATHYLPWTDVEEYVRAGNLVLMTGEEEQQQEG